ncbi:unnamed protein product [Pseudo-nitzschia multistriata]|uniref:Uncharacterized protein n=1 Tax=Pseudo-nitzschia multistriata TaxID=183589 RepID=A0A448Z2U4_9STRA|nr:unnamed protein product [Pseudo-nitzschia multistriata]
MKTTPLLALAAIAGTELRLAHGFSGALVPQRHRLRAAPLALQSSNDNDDDNDETNAAPSSPRVKFRGIDASTTGGGSSGGDSFVGGNPLDRFLAVVASDSFSIASGAIGLLAVVVHRWNLVLAASDGSTAASIAAAEALTYQTRTDLLGVFAAGSVLLNGVTKLDVTTALAESVVLEGKALPSPESVGGASGERPGPEVAWGLESVLGATPARSAVLLGSDKDGGWVVLHRAGVVPPVPAPVPGKTPILDRVGSPGNTRETYLPTLQALPGRTELNYLPPNAQMAVMLPIAAGGEAQSENESESESGSGNSVLVLGGNAAKSFTPRDIAWSRIVAERIGESL